MITARRSDGYTATENTRGGVDLLERASVKYELPSENQTESMEEAKARMQRNLANLLNYDRYSELEAEEQTAAKVQEETVAETKAYSDEDIRPTTTTTQFIDGDPQIFNDAQRNKQEEKVSYKLNAKGKLVVVLYALVVTVILALIVLNTGVLRSLSKEVSALERTYSERLSAIAVKDAEIAEMSSEARVTAIAENELGMVLR